MLKPRRLSELSGNPEMHLLHPFGVGGPHGHMLTCLCPCGRAEVLGGRLVAAKIDRNRAGRMMAPFFQGPIAGAGPGARVRLWKRGIVLDETAPV